MRRSPNPSETAAFRAYRWRTKFGSVRRDAGIGCYGNVATIFDVVPSGFGVTTTVAPSSSKSFLTLGTSAFGTLGMVSCRAMLILS